MSSRQLSEIRNRMTLAELLKILEKERRLVVTAKNIDAVRQLTRDDRISLRRRHPGTDESVMKIYGVVNHFMIVPNTMEPEIGDFLHVNDGPTPKEPRKPKSK
jgi:hypothetical protein